MNGSKGRRGKPGDGGVKERQVRGDETSNCDGRRKKTMLEEVKENQTRGA